MRRIAISDIHGCRRSFEALLDKISLSKDDELYLLGDYIDRGPDSKGVIDFVFELREKGHAVHCLIGNHEAMMLAATEDDMWRDTWRFNGGWATLQSFGVTAADQVADRYFEFLHSLPYYYEVGNYLLVHAGLNFLETNPLKDEDSMLWIRDWYGEVDRQWLNGRVVVHGHTPIPREVAQQQLEQLDEQPVLDIDCGCVFSQSSRDVGYLCAFDLTNRTLHFQRNVELDET